MLECISNRYLIMSLSYPIMPISSNKKVTDGFVVDALTSITDVAHVKDVKTKQYINCNSAMLKCVGLEKLEQIAGLTVKDLDNFMRPYWGEEYAKKIDQFDYLVCNKKETICHKETTVTRSGFVVLQTLIKIPVIDNNNKVSSIFTLTQDLTDTLSLELLYTLYQSHYSTKAAINYFLKYLELDGFFIKPLTEPELLKLITFKKAPTRRDTNMMFDELQPKLKSDNLVPLLSVIEKINLRHLS